MGQVSASSLPCPLEQNEQLTHAMGGTAPLHMVLILRIVEVSQFGDSRSHPGVRGAPARRLEVLSWESGGLLFGVLGEPLSKGKKFDQSSALILRIVEGSQFGDSRFHPWIRGAPARSLEVLSRESGGLLLGCQKNLYQKGH